MLVISPKGVDTHVLKAGATDSPRIHQAYVTPRPTCPLSEQKPVWTVKLSLTSSQGSKAKHAACVQVALQINMLA